MPRGGALTLFARRKQRCSVPHGPAETGRPKTGVGATSGRTLRLAIGRLANTRPQSQAVRGDQAKRSAYPSISYPGANRTLRSCPGSRMSQIQSRVTIHMVASLDGFIARKNGSVDWLEVRDTFEGGKSMDPELVRDFLANIDCYVMGSQTYETALKFETNGFGWAYGDTPTVVLTSRDLPRKRTSVELYSGDLTSLVNERLRPRFRNIWFVGGGSVSGTCLRLRLADEVRYSIMPIVIGEGISFFGGLQRDTALHLRDVNAYKNGMVELHYDVLK